MKSKVTVVQVCLVVAIIIGILAGLTLGDAGHSGRRMAGELDVPNHLLRIREYSRPFAV